MKKAVIVTFHCVPNYGAVLQAYALQSKLTELGLDAGILDYRPKHITKEYRSINTYSIFSLAHSIWSLIPFLQKKKKFELFEEKYFDLVDCTEKDGALYMTDEQPDVIFLGSDQIWNPDITHGFDKVYFGDVQTLRPIKTAAYAASIGKKCFTDAEKTEFKALIEKVTYVAVREREAQDMILCEFGKNVELTVDPTILAGRECFEKLAVSVPFKHYLLFYSLIGMPEALAMAEKIARYCGYELLELSGRRKPYIAPRHKVIYNAGPTDFVSLFYNADYVVTDSFHGTVFSLLFHKKFISLASRERGGRITGLLESVNMLHRCTDRFDRKIVQEEIDWEIVDQRLKRMRSVSLNYINHVLEGE